MSNTPLFIVTGLSGAGKTKASKVLRRLAQNFYVFDMDILVEHKDFQKAACQWLTIARYNSISHKATVLFGPVPNPYNIEECPDYKAFSTVHTALLHCDPEDRYARLKERGNIWLEENIRLTIEEADHIYKKAVTDNMPIINTSRHSVEEVAEGLFYWVENILHILDGKKS